MKILYLINSLNIGGAEVLLLNITENLKLKGHEVEIVCLEDGHDHIKEKAKEKNISWRTLKGKRYLSIFEMLAYVKRNGPYDICHTHLYPAFLYGVILKVFSSVKVLLHSEHSSTNNRRRWWFKPIDRLLYRCVNSVVSISEGVSKELVQWLPELYEKIEIIFNCVSFSEKKEDYSLGENIKLLCVGRLVEDKNIFLQLDALRHVEKIRIDYVGNGHLLRELNDYAYEKNVNHKVRFLGPVKNLETIYKNYDALVLSSKNEGFGLVVAEAISAGLPVIVGNITGVREVAGHLGIYFDVNDEKSLVDKINIFREMSAEQRAALGTLLIERSQLFSIDSYVNQLTTLYQELIEAK